MPTPHANPRSPLVFDTRALGRQPGAAYRESRVVPAPVDLNVALARVPVGADVELIVELEPMSGGVLVSGEATAPVTGECARCLEPVTSKVDVTFRELYESDGEPAAREAAEDDRRFLDGGLLDLEPALRDAMVLALPLSPLCRDDCAGLCPECGARLAEAGPGHTHADAPDPRWARLRQLNVEERQGGARAVGRQEG